MANHHEGILKEGKECPYASTYARISDKEAWSNGLKTLIDMVRTGRMPASLATALSSQGMETWGYTISLGLLIMLLMIRSSRRMILESVETVLVCILIVLLLGIVIAMPFATLYIGYRGISFVAVSLLNTYRRS
jgi:glucan phosphoethanolaminetransferase (alkaline phosphatase superfamily)